MNRRRLMQGTVDDSAWEKRDLGIWSLPDHVNVKHAVMHRKFTVPSGWTSGYVGLCVAQHTGHLCRRRTDIHRRPGPSPGVLPGWNLP